MTHVALHSVPEAGREDGYDLAHRRIPDDLPAAFAQLARDPILPLVGRMADQQPAEARAPYT